jgi:hypothetical protein
MWKREDITKQTHPEYWKLILKAIPDYRKRSASVCFTDSVTLNGRYWSGGSINYYHLVGKCGVKQIPNRTDFPFTAPDTEIHFQSEPDWDAVVESGYFCGKKSHAVLYLQEK